MNNFNNNRSGGYKGTKKFGARDTGERRFNSSRSGGGASFDAICADCGNNCRVPFEPSNGRPVYCSNCFEKRGNGQEGPRTPGRSNFDKPDFSEKRPFSAPLNNNSEDIDKKFDAMNAKLDKILKTLSYMTR